MGRSFYAAAGIALALSCAAHAAPQVKTQHVEAELIAERAAAQPGKPVVVGLKLRMEPQWHTYWKNPGDSGLPTKIQWILPEGWKAGEIQWPYPQKLPVGPLMNYGYEDEVVLLSEITPPASAAAGPANLKAKAEWLVCKDICIPEKGELDLVLPVAAAEGAPNPRAEAPIARARNQLPVAMTGWKYDAAISGKTLVVRMTAPPGTTPPAKLFFFPEREMLIEPAAPQTVTREGQSVRIEMRLAEPVATGVTSVAGVAVSDAGWPGTQGRKAVSVVAPVGAGHGAAGILGGGSAAGGSSTPGDRSALGGSTLAALAFAFLGGILLNLMPCVFPVLGIKVMGFVRHAHGDARALRVQGIVFALGVLLSFLGLAGLMLGLRAGGTQLGWGFQLQSPPVVMLLAALFFVLALNLSGVFQWGAFAQSMTSRMSARGRNADAFLSGVLASVVATPCTAPFMGAAVGFTVSQGPALALAVFLTLGFGMALPVLLLAFFPALLRRLPKPGAWMETFKQVLAFPLYATVAWLAWVLGAQAGNDAVLALMGGLVLVAMGAWVYGRWAHAGSLWQPAVAVLFTVAGVALAWPGPDTAPGTAVARAGELPWQPWSPEKVSELTAQGRPVFVDFTAAWCVTCQVNKRVALHNEAVIQAFALRDMAALKADWTRQDPRITEALAALGRNAVPVYAIYAPGSATPRLLPEVLTPSLVLDEIARLPAGKPRTSVTLSERSPRERP
jgi:thiol:disulfide interchange protein/DsbC/DsbD-like thiol-disulfide interchange protein